MKKTFRILIPTALVLLGISGCRTDDTGLAMLFGFGSKTTKIQLAVGVRNNEIRANRKLDFVWQGSVPAEGYYVRFVNANPCLPDGAYDAKTYTGTTAADATCTTKSDAKASGHYLYKWGKLPVPPLSDDPVEVPFNAVVCKPHC